MPDKLLSASLGLDLDSSKIAISQGIYTYGLNGVITEKLFAQNEPSNEKCFDFPDGYYSIGSVVVDEHVVYFLANPTTEGSEIGIADKFCNYTTLVNNSCLNFKINKPIKAVYKPNSVCGRNIYWTDDYNEMRWMDIDNISSPFDCTKIRVFQFTSNPCIQIDSESLEQGKLSSGVIQVSIQYSDQFGNGLSAVFGFTNPYPIVKDSIAGSSNVINGVAADTPTNKAVRILFSNLSSTYDFFNLIVVKTINGIKSAEKVITLPVSTGSYTYTGFEETVDLVLDEVVADAVTYETAKEVLQVNKRLMWGNLTATQEANFQPYANQIKVQWQLNRVLSANYLHTYKNPYYTTYYKGFMRDEVYALGIRLKYTNGTKSCTYHIPGRIKNVKSNGTVFNNPVDQYGVVINDPNNSWDTTLITSNSDAYELVPKERWEVYNTATIEGNDLATGQNEGCYYYGEMSYWESTDTYPTDQEIWGDLAGQKIRHHKMPDVSIAPLHDGINGNADILDVPYINFLGLRIENVNIDPALFPDVEGWEIVIGDRTNQKSVIAKGLFYSMMSHTSETDTIVEPVTPVPYFYQNFPYNDVTTFIPNGGTTDSPVANLLAFHSPETSFISTGIGNAVEFKKESEEYGKFAHKYISSETGTNIDGGADYTLINSHYGYSNYSKYRIPVRGNVRRAIAGKEYLLNNTYQTTFIGNINNLERESCVMIMLDGLMDVPIEDDNSKSVFTTSSDVATGNMAAWYGSLKQPSTNLYGTIDSITYLSTGLCTIDDDHKYCFFGGDTFVSDFGKHIRDSFILNDDEDSALWNQATPPNTQDSNLYQYGMGVTYFWVESSINCAYRHPGETNKEQFYPNLKDNLLNYKTWLSPANIWFDVDNYYYYNFDYSAKNDIKFNCIAPLTFLECSNDFPTRVIYSEQQVPGSLIDSYLIYLANSYANYPEEDIEIWQMFASQDVLFVRTIKNIFHHKLNFQQLQTDVNNIIVGTGALFAIPPVPFGQVDNGYGGTQSQWCINQTPYGIMLVDGEGGQVYQLTDKLNEISRTKMYRFFRSNLPSMLKKQVDSKYGQGTYVGFDNPQSPWGTGVISAWDSEFQRWIITKRDYAIRDMDLFGPTGSLSYDPSTDRFVDERSGPVELSDTSRFCNISFTLSYSFLTDKWAFFHSYIPNGYVSVKETFYSLTGNSVYKHNIPCSYQTFYDELRPFILEFTDTLNSFDNFTSPSIVWSQENEQCVGDNETEGKSAIGSVTFNKAYVYNDSEHSGLLSLVLPDLNDLSSVIFLPEVGTNLTAIDLGDREGVFSFSDFWDINKYPDKNVNLNATTCDNEDFIESYPIDKVPNNLVLDYNKAWWDKERFRGNWISYRLIQDVHDDTKIITNFFNIDKKESLR